MLSDTLFEFDCALRKHQIEDASFYSGIKDRIDAIRCLVTVLQIELDTTYPHEWLEGNPIYEAAKAGDIKPHDDFMDGDDYVLEEFKVLLRQRMDAAGWPI